ncbi:CHAT domain-containing protein, partial [Streptomonospora salina]|uniref:CHAT domain-containing protein n=1 Tax=Streptomonospora salina TaxID=104205 RepID=UPI0035E759F1
GPGPRAAPPNPRRDDTHRCPPPAGAGSGCADTAEAATALAHCVHSAPLGPVSAMLPSGPEAAALRVIAAGDHRSPRGRLVDPPGGHRPARHLELIVHARAHRREVAAAGARAALRAGDAPAALDWTEFASAPALPAGPCRNGPWLDLLDRCRALHARAHRGDAAARRELPALAETLSTAQWHADCMTAESGGAPSRHEPPAAAALSRNLAGRAFVRYVRVHGTDTAITVVDGRTRLHPLPSAPAVEDAVAKLSYAARTRVLSGDEETSAPDGVAAAARRVDRLLIGPVSETVGDRPLVIAPSPPVQALPWGLLPSLRGREVSVAPSGRAWLAGGGADADPPTGPGRVVLAAGGAPQGAAGEVGALASVYPGAAVLRGAEARVEQVLRAAAGAGVAHLAAHGSASAQTPMLAAVRMEDGPLFAYDIERLSRAPRVTVLSSCWVGGAMPASSGAPLGMAASLLAMGGRVVVAGVLPVSDRTVGSAMLGFHRALRAGTAPARAVADHLAGAGFVCYGTG